MIGNMLNGREQQFLATRDELTSTWRILNTWHDSLKRINPDDDIPDDSPAVTILTEGAYIALVTESARLGLLENVSYSNFEDISPLLDEANAKIETLNAEIQSLQSKTVQLSERPQHSEGYDLKSKAMDNILKLAALGDVTNLGDN